MGGKPICGECHATRFYLDIPFSIVYFFNASFGYGKTECIPQIRRISHEEIDEPDARCPFDGGSPCLGLLKRSQRRRSEAAERVKGRSDFAGAPGSGPRVSEIGSSTVDC